MELPKKTRLIVGASIQQFNHNGCRVVECGGGIIIQRDIRYITNLEEARVLMEEGAEFLAPQYIVDEIIR